MTYSTSATRKIRLNDFAISIAEKIQLWLCSLSRHQYLRDEKDWELGMGCVLPLDELFIVAVGPILQSVANDETWGIVLYRMKRS